MDVPWVPEVNLDVYAVASIGVGGIPRVGVDS